MKKKIKKKWVIGISAVAVVAVVGTIVGLRVSAKGKSASTTTFRKTTAQTGSISTSVSGSGSVSATSQITLTAANAGTVDSVSVKQGDTVAAGQAIAHVNSSASAQTVEQKQNQLTSAQSDLAQVQSQLDSLSVKSPVAGKVKAITASAGDSLSTIKPLGDLAVISTSRSMSVSFNPSETVRMGQSVTVAVSGKTYAGTISSGSSGGQGGGQSGSVSAVIGSDDPTVGDTATVTLNGDTIGSGKIQLTSSVPISNSGNGTVSKVYVSENQMVSKNQSLFLLSGDSVQQQITAKQNAVKSAQEDLDAAQSDAAKNTVTSPISGVVAELDVKVGDSVTGGGNVAVIVNQDAMQTVVAVDEMDISKVSAGQKATISLDAITGKTFSGSVLMVDPIGTASNGVATYNVTVSIDNPQGIKVGMTTNVAIITQSKDNVLVVPSGAILMKNGTQGYVLPADQLFDSNGKSIQLTNTNTAQLVRKYGKEVTIGMATVDQDEIVSGVSNGDALAIPITINQAALQSLSNQGTSNNSFGFGGMSGRSGGYGGTAGRSGYGGSTNRKSGGSGNTVAANGGSTNGSANGSTTNGGTGNGNGTGAAAQGGTQRSTQGGMN